MKIKFNTKSIYTILALLTVSSLNAISLKDTVKQTILTNEEITTNNLRVKAIKTQIGQAKAGYYPTLNLDAYLEKSRTRNKFDTNPNNNPTLENRTGHNIALTAEQLLYDGGKTSGAVNKSEYRYKEILNNTSWKNENVLLDIVKSYTELLKLNEQTQYSSFLTKAHKESIVVAKDKEEISGEALPTQQSLAMLSTQIDKEDKLIINYNKALSEFERLTSLKAEDLCKPQIDRELFNVPLEDVLKISLENNYKIKEQENKLMGQKYSLSQSKSNYKPRVTLNANSIYDNDLQNSENGNKNDLAAQLRLTWNLYNGGADKLKNQEEQILLQKERKQLEVAKKELIKSTTDAYNKYHKTLNRVENLKEAVIANEKILKLTKEQLADGTKTFIEETQAKDKLIESKINLSTQEFEVYNKYYDLLNELSILSKTVLLAEDTECKSIIVDNPLISESDLSDLQLDDTNLDTNSTDDNISDNNITDNSDLKDEISKLVEDTYMNYDENNLNINLQITHKSFTLKRVNPNDQFRFKLDSIAQNLLKTVFSHQNEIQEVRLESYTSSEYTKYIDQSLEVQAKANTDLSLRRGNKVKQYFINQANALGLPTNLVEEKFMVYGMGPKDLVLNADGTENRVASRRVEIKIIKK